MTCPGCVTGSPRKCAAQLRTLTSRSRRPERDGEFSSNESTVAEKCQWPCLESVHNKTSRRRIVSWQHRSYAPQQAAVPKADSGAATTALSSTPGRGLHLPVTRRIARNDALESPTGRRRITLPRSRG